MKKPGARVLYLGAASGTTVSHVSDIVGPYKLYVDGKWGYDEFEHHVIGDYVIMNTLHLSMDDMDVDNDTFSALG
uniref:Uncharacterized protein n=1 Tax=Quercus lobata TaxID=97700 RepID=A0A7N2N0L2_QUELO